MFQKKTYKVLDVTRGHKCARCSHERNYSLVEEKTWFVFLVLPLFSYKKRHLLVCSVCGAAYALKQPLSEIRRPKQTLDPEILYAGIKDKLAKGEISENEYIRMRNIIDFHKQV